MKLPTTINDKKYEKIEKKNVIGYYPKNGVFIGKVPGIDYSKHTLLLDKDVGK